MEEDWKYRTCRSGREDRVYKGWNKIKEIEIVK